MEEQQLHFAATSIISFIVYIIILTACITIYLKKKTISTILLLLGCVLRVLAFALGTISSYFFGSSGNILQNIIITNYFNTLAFILFGIGLLLFALNDLKDNDLC
ncbi:hypothetical protein [Lacinutrix salivirga]